MDAASHSQTPTNSRKRNRENETPQQRIKREKAAERQRRKRERDRAAAQAGLVSYQVPSDHIQQQQPPPPPPPPQPQPQQPVPHTHPSDFNSQELTPEELARRDRVRAAARERQRKHRALVKQRKMRELGLEMAADLIPNMDEVHYRINTDAQYQQVIAPDMHQQQQHPMGPPEPPFPQGQPGQQLGGQTFASTLLLSFSCAPLLKQHLLRTLNMTNEELASLEPIIAEAWDHWDHQRRMHGQVPGPSVYPVDMSHTTTNNGTTPYSAPVTTGTDPAQTAPNEFRARFHRPLVAPTPFRAFNDAQANATASTPGNNAGPPETIDPHLSAVPNGHAATSESRHTNGALSIDPDFRQARGEAEGVVGRLETVQ